MPPAPRRPSRPGPHAQTYVDQVWHVLDRERTIVEYNDRWLAGLTFGELIGLASQFTVQQFLARDNFRQRFDEGHPIWLHEFFYALMQAYDAEHLHTDAQVGGTEQLFNLMAGRKWMAARGLRPQICLTLPILVGTDGRRRMSKSTGNTIGIAEAPETQYGKVMSIPTTRCAPCGPHAGRPPASKRCSPTWTPEGSTTRPEDASRARSSPRYTVRTRRAAEEAFRAVFQAEPCLRRCPSTHCGLKRRPRLVAGLANSAVPRGDWWSSAAYARWAHRDER